MARHLTDLLITTACMSAIWFGMAVIFGGNL
jgi:hypothetical protein